MLEIVVFLAILLDITFGDPKNKFHPTAWIGILIAKLTILHNSYEKLGGVCLVVIPVFIISLLLLLVYVGLDILSNTIISIIVIAILLKTTLAIRGMEKHAMAVVKNIENDDLVSARQHLAMIVKRDTKNLDKNHIYSGVIESVSENTVDGVTGPLFYFGFFGIFGAFVYRIVNTADSMVGYKNNLFINVGWFAATSDRILNYLPSRLTGIMMVLCSIILRVNWRESYRVMMCDCTKTESPNAGYPMAATAGALNIGLEKINHYSIGNGTKQFSRKHVIMAIKLMKLASIMFGLVIVTPTIIILSYVGLWIHA